MNGAACTDLRKSGARGRIRALPFFRARGVRVLPGVLAILLFPPAAAGPAAARSDGSVPKGGHLFILSGQSNMTGALEKGFAATVTKALGEEQVTIVRSTRSGRGIRFWVKEYEMHFVIGRISDYGLEGDRADSWRRMREIQVGLAEGDSRGAWIDTDDLNGGGPDKPRGQLHYPGDEAVKLGERFGHAALRQLADGGG